MLHQRRADPALLVSRIDVQLVQIGIVEMHVADRKAGDAPIHVRHERKTAPDRHLVIAQRNDAHGADVDQVAVAKQLCRGPLDILQPEDIGHMRCTQRKAHEAIDPCNAVKNRIASGPSRARRH